LSTSSLTLASTFWKSARFSAIAFLLYGWVGWD